MAWISLVYEDLIRRMEDKTTNRFSWESLGRLQLIPWLFVALVVFSLGFVPLRASHDEWWHLKTGKWIVEHNFQLPQNDIFTYTAASYPWHNHEWLSQTIMYLIWKVGDDYMGGGWRLLILFKAFLLVATYLLLGRFISQRAGPGNRGLWIAVFVTLIAAAASRRTFWPRPPVISYFFITFYLYVLWMHRSGRLRTPWLFVLPALMPLWVNLHGGFIVGNIMLAAYCGGEFIEWIGLTFSRAPSDQRRAKFLNVICYGFIGFLCGLASLLNPYGYHLYLLAGRVMNNPVLLALLSEMLPPDFRFTWAFNFMVVLIAIGFCFLIVRTLLKKSRIWPPLAEIILVAFFMQQALSHVRHLPLFALISAPLVVWFLREWWGSDLHRSRPLILQPVLMIASLIVGLWLVFLPGEAIGYYYYLKYPDVYVRLPNYFNRNIALLHGQELLPGEYPEEAMNFVVTAKLPGRMYNRNYLAGYPIWRLSPEHYKVFTDNRFDIFGGDFLLDEISVAEGWPGGVYSIRSLPEKQWPVIPNWRKVIDRWQFNWIFVEESEGINEVLRQKDSGWKKIYQGGGLNRMKYVIWLKDIPSNRPWIEKYEIKEIEGSGNFPPSFY